MSGVDFGELVEGLSETVGYRRAREVVAEAVEDSGVGRRDEYAVDEALTVCDHVAETHPSPLSLAARTLRNRLRVRRLDRSATDAPSLFENAVDPAVEVAFTTRGAVVRRTNDRFASAFDLDPETATGQPLEALPVPPTDPAEREELLRRLRAGETLDVEVTVEDETGEPHDGPGIAPGLTDLSRERTYRLRGIGALQGEEVTSGYLVYTDITERKRHERELERRNEHLEAFASIVSHDLRNPLGIARGYLDLARDEAEVPHADDIEEALERMDDIIEEMLVLARGSQSLADPEPVSVEDVAREAWRHVATGDATLEVGELGAVRSDHNRLLHVFENCYRNAVEHGSTSPRSETREDAVEHGSTSPRSETREDAVEHGSTSSQPEADDADDDGPPVTVRVWLDDDGLHVADDGAGMTPEVREQATEAGYSSASDGTGMGLFIVREIAEAHGWDVSLNESEAGGLRVSFHDVERC